MTAVATEQNKLTATEALAEIVTLGKRIAKRMEGVFPYLARQRAVTDPLERDIAGGSPAFIQQERQAINDLMSRWVALRTAIQRMNNVETITIAGQTRTISEWLTWRKEILPLQKVFLNKIRNTIEQNRNTAKGSRGEKVSVVSIENADMADRMDWVINLSERELLQQIEQLETIEGTLDGQLSLKNATVVLEV